MSYGKLINEQLFYYNGRIINPDGSVTLTRNDEAAILAAGYKPLIYTDAPECGEDEYAVCSWIEHENNLVQTWNISGGGVTPDIGNGGNSGMGNGWRLIREVIIPNDVTEDTSGVTWITNDNGAVKSFSFNTDTDGETFTLSDISIFGQIRGETNAYLIGSIKKPNGDNVRICAISNCLGHFQVYRKIIGNHVLNLFSSRAANDTTSEITTSGFCNQAKAEAVEFSFSSSATTFVFSVGTKLWIYGVDIQ